MAAVFKIKQNDTADSLLYYLLPTSTDLTGASVVFNMRNRSSGTVKVSRQAASVVTATTRPSVQYDWQAGDTDTAGDYEYEFEVTFADTTVKTFPNDSWEPLKITDDIA